MFDDLRGSKFVAETNTRQASRAPVTLKIKFKSETLDQFIERYSVDISHGGIFIRTKDPLAVGTALKFEFQLKDASPLITGEGTVVWTREPDAKRAGVSPGMGVRFDKLPGESQKVLDKVLARKSGKLSAEVQPMEDDDDAAGDFVDSPTRVAPAGLVDSLVGSNEYDDADLTPLPKPMPFHGDVDDFSNDAFNESTKVASLDQILAQAEGSAESEESAYDEDAVFASTSPPAKAAAKKSPSDAAASTTAYEDPFADLNEMLDDKPASGRPDSERADTRAETEVIPAKQVLARDEFAAAEASDDDSDLAESSVQDDFDDDTDDDDRELDDDDDGTDNDDKPAASTGPARAAVLESTVDEEHGSSMPWIAVAAVILLIGGAGGFWLLNKNKDKKISPVAKAQLQEPTETPKLPDTAINDPIKEPEHPEIPALPTQPVAITTIPEGATVRVEGTELSAVSPASFDLEEGKTFALLVEHPEFISQRLEVAADGSELKPLKLAPKDKLLRIHSQPPGAIITVNGQRLRGQTPLDLPVSRRMEAMETARVQLRLPGYQPAEGKVSMSEGFESSETQLVMTFMSVLQKAPTRPSPNLTPNDRRQPKGDPNEGDTNNGGADTEKVDPNAGKSEPGKVDPKKSEPVKPDPVKADPTDGEPTPDWMK